MCQQVIGPVSAHVLELVVTGSDRLADHGNDRTFNIFHALVNINLQRLITYACNSDEMLPWRRQVCVRMRWWQLMVSVCSLEGMFA